MRLLRAEWTKLRTRRAWAVTLLGALIATLGLNLLITVISRATCSNGDREVVCEAPPTGPEGGAVQDRFYFVHQRLDGDGAITARITSMTGRIKEPPPPGTAGPMPVPGMVPWAKAGVMIKDGIRVGSAYAALMLTAEHGVRLQHNYIHDQPGRPGATPRWLRLTRAGETITGHESTDGKSWHPVGTITLPGLPPSVEIGLFAASPGDLTVNGFSQEKRFAEVTAEIDHVSLPGPWRTDDISVQMEPDGVTPHHPGGLKQSGDTYTVTGVGDIGPADIGQAVERILVGTLIALLAVIVVAAAFATAEPRHTPAPTPSSPSRVLVAKATVIGAVAFAIGLLASAASIPLGTRILKGNGIHVLPVDTLTELRVILGTAAILALSAVLALALGALLQRTSLAVIAALTLIVVPYLLATTSAVPSGVGEWLLRLTPAAGFAIQQSTPAYDHVLGLYTPSTGYFPLPPWTGLAVLTAYTALALALALALATNQARQNRP